MPRVSTLLQTCLSKVYASTVAAFVFFRRKTSLGQAGNGLMFALTDLQYFVSL